MYKIDFEKAYDWVDQEFMRLTLSEFGFPSYKKNLMMNCVISTSLALRNVFRNHHSRLLNINHQTRGLTKHV